MPTYEYQCENDHITEDIRKVADRKRPMLCETCGASATLTISHTNVNGSGVGVRGSSSVYWPNKGIAQPRLIENLSHKPILVPDKKTYRKVLQETNSREAG